MNESQLTLLRRHGIKPGETAGAELPARREPGALDRGRRGGAGTVGAGTGRRRRRAHRAPARRVRAGGLRGGRPQPVRAAGRGIRRPGRLHPGGGRPGPPRLDGHGGPGGATTGGGRQPALRAHQQGAVRPGRPPRRGGRRRVHGAARGGRPAGGDPGGPGFRRAGGGDGFALRDGAWSARCRPRCSGPQPEVVSAVVRLSPRQGWSDGEYRPFLQHRQDPVPAAAQATGLGAEAPAGPS